MMGTSDDRGQLRDPAVKELKASESNPCSAEKRRPCRWRSRRSTWRFMMWEHEIPGGAGRIEIMVAIPRATGICKS